MADILQLAVGALFGGGITFLVAQRKLQADNVTAEHTKWRERVRQLTGDVVAGGDANLWAKVAVNTNPLDPRDVAILNLVRRLDGMPPSSWDADELVGRMALLLKHDWERAKRETSWLPLDHLQLPLIGRDPVGREDYHGPIYGAEPRHN